MLLIFFCRIELQPQTLLRNKTIFDKKSVEKNQWMIDPDDAVILLIDHQSGLFQLVRGIDQPTLRVLTKMSYLAKIPTFTTASVPDGPLIPETHQYNPDAVYTRVLAKLTPGITPHGSKPSRKRDARH
jgi:hypothetical protein